MLSEKKFNPMLGNELTLPSFDAASGTIVINGKTYTVYYSMLCTEDQMIKTETVTHTGTYDQYSATVENSVMKLYCKLIEETAGN